MKARCFGVMALREYHRRIKGVASTKEVVEAQRTGLLHEDVLTTTCLGREMARARGEKERKISGPGSAVRYRLRTEVEDNLMPTRLYDMRVQMSSSGMNRAGAAIRHQCQVS